MRQLRLIEPCVGEAEVASVTSVLRSGWLTEGKVTGQLERLMCRYVGTRFAVATTSCTTALELSLEALGVARGDEVVVPDFTHPGTALAVMRVGAQPVLVDVELDSHNVSASLMEEAVSWRTKCVMPVSWGGYPLEPDIKESLNIPVVEDAACSLGAAWNKRMTGSIADVTGFSFHPRKLITCGEGGMIVTNNKEVAESIRKLKNFGFDIEKRVFVSLGTNCKLSDVQAALALPQLGRIEQIIARRVELARAYMDLLRGVKHLAEPVVPKHVRHVFQTFTVLLDSHRLRDKLLRHLRRKGVEAQIGTYALHLQPCFSNIKQVGGLVNSTRLYECLLALPMSHNMKQEDQEYVVDQIKHVVQT